MMGLTMKAAGIWALMLIIAIILGAGREMLLTPAVGELSAHQIGSILFSVCIFLLVYSLIPTMKLTTHSAYWLLGISWVAMTVTFEFLFGHFVMGHSWSRLLADYNLLQGRLWILILMVTGISPFIAAKLRGLF